MDTATYQQKLSSYFSASCVMMALQLAKDVGILDILYSATGPLTSNEIAEQGKLKERYVREILGALAASEIVQVDSTSQQFHVPEEHKFVLRKVAAFGNIVQCMGFRMKEMENIFSNEGPDVLRFDDAMFDALCETRILTQDSILEHDILSPLPEIKDKLKEGIHVAELGCAQGILILNLAERYPKSTFVGSDISEKCIEKARKSAAKRKLKNVTFEVMDLMEIPQKLNDSFDWIFVRDTIHDLPIPAKALEGIKRALKKQGTASIAEIGMKGQLADHRGDIFWARMYALSTFFCIPESYQRRNSDTLGACWGVEKARDLINNSGLTLTKEFFSEKNPGSVSYICQK